MSSCRPCGCVCLCLHAALCVYSLFFMRWALAITPANYPLLFCHFCNEVAQLSQLARWLSYKLSDGSHAQRLATYAALGHQHSAAICGLVCLCVCVCVACTGVVMAVRKLLPCVAKCDAMQVQPHRV